MHNSGVEISFQDLLVLNMSFILCAKHAEATVEVVFPLDFVFFLPLHFMMERWG